MPRRSTDTPRLTEKRVQSLAYPWEGKDRPHYVPDHVVPRLYVRVQPTGRKTYVIRYYLEPGKKRNHTLGTTDQLRLVEARRLANDLLADLDVRGIDPKSTKRRPSEVPTFAEFVETYFENHGDQLRSRRELRRVTARQLLPRFGRARLTEIRLEDVLKMRSQLADSPYEANRARDLLQAMLNKALEWEVLPTGFPNPVKKVPRYKEMPRERVLKEDEVLAILQAIDSIDSPYTRVLFRTLLDVPMRKNEVMRATWEGFDPAARTLRVETLSDIKSVSAQPLTDELRDLISALPRIDGNPFIFPSRDRKSHIKDIDSQWKRVKKVAGVTDVRLHDLRRTIATDYARMGASTFQIQTALGHATGIAAKHYVQLAAADVSRELMDRRTANRG